MSPGLLGTIFCDCLIRCDTCNRWLVVWSRVGFQVHVSVCDCLLSPVWLFVTPWTIVCQASLSMEFSRQEYWSGLAFPAPGDLLKPSDQTCFSCISWISRWILYHCTTWEAKRTCKEGLSHSWGLSFPWENQVVWLLLCTKMFIVLLMLVKTPILERFALPMFYLGSTRLVPRILQSA